MGPKEKIKYFKMIFLKLINKIPETSKPNLDIQIDFYSSTLPVSIAMFIKRANKNTLIEAMHEALEVEKEISSIASKSSSEDSISSQTTKKVIIKEEKKDKDAFDMGSLKKIMKTLANEIVNVKGKQDELSNKPFRTFFKKNPQIPFGGQTLEGVNVDEEGEDDEKIQDTNMFGILMEYLMKTIQNNLLLLKPKVKVYLRLLNLLHQQILQIHNMQKTS
jgi:hypothetical protein